MTQHLSLQQEATQVRKLKKAYESSKKKTTELDLQFKRAQQGLYDRMRAEEVDGLKYRGTNFVPASTEYAQVQDAPAFMVWARENQPELLEEKPRKQLLNELIREHLDNGTPLPPGLTFYVREYVSQRNALGKEYSDD